MSIVEDRYKQRIIGDLRKAGLPTDFMLDFRGYSKRLDGTYNPNTKVIVIYARESDGMLRDYDELLEVALHEAVHHYQWNYEEGFKRVRGIMHNSNFYKKYNECRERIEGELHVAFDEEDLGFDSRLFI